MSNLFQDLDLPPVIDTAETSFATEFYEPLLSRATEYDRAVGYFTSGWLQTVCDGMATFAEHGGTARFIVSPILNEEDWEAIRNGTQARQDTVLRENLQQSVDDLRDSLAEAPRNTLAWLIADGILNLRIAVPTEQLDGGDFHDKFGIFRDETSDADSRVAFHGSQNDSIHGQQNYESYDIFCAWDNDRDRQRVDKHEERFEKLWYDETPNVRTYRLPESVKKSIVTLRTTDERPYELPEGHDALDITLREYQQDAVDAWFENGCHGLFQMATGTGKTYTAIGALKEALEDISEPAIVVVAVPVTHLATQWADNLADWGFDSPRYIFGTANSSWKTDLSTIVNDIEIGIGDTEILLTTHKTLSSEYFCEQMRGVDASQFLIADEVHGLGSDDQRTGLLPTYDYRLGLSATPERHYDEEGTDYLLNYFGGIVYEYGLGEAIPEYLTPYEYYPQIVTMTGEELDEYRALSKKLATAAGSDETEEEIVEHLARERAKIIKSAENKYIKLQQVLDSIGEPDHLLVYTNPDQITHVQEILNERGLQQHKFTYHEDDNEREALLSQFDEGALDALVAMRCLDEGVDVPATRQAILMSNSGNPMQFIQRRGRVLRHAPGKKRAQIYDMLVVPSLEPTRAMIESEQSILRKELRRFEEFAENAQNEDQARNVIQELRIAYEL